MPDLDRKIRPAKQCEHPKTGRSDESQEVPRREAGGLDPGESAVPRAVPAHQGNKVEQSVFPDRKSDHELKESNRHDLHRMQIRGIGKWLPKLDLVVDDPQTNRGK